ncbi:alpha-amylase [Lentibacillus persicus]|uniref:Alpha-amylase n=1 Tax=Lentibacillus persicus TaxID=640948 RepID=A0A1I1RU63_9BACI|nr:alpha-amylase family glycosyl hydrolase [Lentibacillus persicus]SFD37795.1 alpha-amylase [Lentibacillus persicus]
MKHLTMIIAGLMLGSFLTIPVSAAEETAAVNSEIYYDILVDRFNNGDPTLDKQVDLDDPLTYHGGDIQGVIDKLDHLKEYGYTTLVLSPIMQNASDGYHGYWIEDFYQVDEQYGTMGDLKKLVEEAHSRDMKVVLEFVTNYASETHPMTEDPAKSDWFKENNGSDTSFQWADKTVSLNQGNPEVRDFMKDVADYWIEEAGIDGYMFHAADQADTGFLNDLTTSLRENNPEFYLLGDVLEDESYNGNLTEKTAIQATENTELFQPVTNVFAEAGTPLTQIYENNQGHHSPESLNYVDTPYMERFTQKALENGRKPLTTWKLTLTYLYTAPGAPLIYQGTEIPMGGTDFPESQKLVEWNSADDDLEQFTNRIAALRSEFPALKYGDYELVGSSGAMSVFKRSYEGQSVYVAINNDTESQVIQVDTIEAGKQLDGLLGDNLARDNGEGVINIGLPRETSEVYVVEPETGINWVVVAPIAGIFLLFVAGVIYLSRKQKRREAEA